VFVRDLQKQDDDSSQCEQEQEPPAPMAIPTGPYLLRMAAFVTFISLATDLVAIPRHQRCGGYFVRDLQNGTTSLVSVQSGGDRTPATLAGGRPLITPDGGSCHS
jgi:hypothetical protein